MLHYPIEDRIGLVRGELVILRGTEDFLCPTGWVDRLGRAAAGARVRTSTIDGAAHQVIVADADKVVSEMLRAART